VEEDIYPHMEPWLFSRACEVDSEAHAEHPLSDGGELRLTHVELRSQWGNNSDVTACENY